MFVGCHNKFPGKTPGDHKQFTTWDSVFAGAGSFSLRRQRGISNRSGSFVQTLPWRTQRQFLLSVSRNINGSAGNLFPHLTLREANGNQWNFDSTFIEHAKVELNARVRSLSSRIYFDHTTCADWHRSLALPSQLVGFSRMRCAQGLVPHKADRSASIAV